MSEIPEMILIRNVVFPIVFQEGEIPTTNERPVASCKNTINKRKMQKEKINF